jgi:hypothetical protein
MMNIDEAGTLRRTWKVQGGNMNLMVWVLSAAQGAATDERGEVNTAAILAWTVLAVVAILGIQIAFDGLVTDVFEDVKSRILGHSG